jgi:hypothetical protein
MATYGRGQMLGSGINPESFKLDYSGMANAAATQAQGVANLGASIGGAISEVGDYFKKQAEDEKKVQKSLSVAKAIGDLIPGLQPTIQGSLNILNDKELPLSQRTAEADAIADILNLGINEVRNRQDVGFKERELGIREAEALARNAPPMPEPFKLQDKLLSVAGGNVLVKEGSDGQTYDQTGQYPVYDLDAYLRGEPPEVYSNPGNTAVPLLNGEATDPLTGMNAQGIQDATELGQGSVIPSKLGTPDLDLARSIAALEDELGIKPNVVKGLKSRLITEPNKADTQKAGRVVTIEELNSLTQQGIRFNAIPNQDGTFIVTEVTPAALSPDVIERNTKAYNDARALYEAGDRAGSLSLLRALRARDMFGDITDETLDSYFGKSSANVPSKKPLGEIIK